MQSREELMDLKNSRICCESNLRVFHSPKMGIVEKRTSDHAILFYVVATVPSHGLHDSPHSFE